MNKYALQVFIVNFMNCVVTMWCSFASVLFFVLSIPVAIVAEKLDSVS